MHVLDVSFNPSRPSEVASAGEDGSIKTWDLRSVRDAIALTPPDMVRARKCVSYLLIIF